ncbi:MAG TPA: EAL domain-containing protein [Alphaproteobacteria bacterium]
MPVVSHVLIALGYAVIAGVIAVALPQVAPVDGRVAVELAGVVIFVAALVHLASARLRLDQAEAAEIDALKIGYAELRSELARARDEARRIFDAIRAASDVRQGQAQNIDTVMAEVRVLQDLVEQLSAGKKPKGKPSYIVDDKKAPVPAEAATSRVIMGLKEEEILDMVREALRDNKVELFVQPIVSLPQRKRRHYECFSRIRGEHDAILMPDQYLAIAEREGLIGAIDNMLLFRSIQVVRRLQKANSDANIFINISEHTVADTRFLREFVAFMASNRDLAPHLVFEFSQASVQRRSEEAMAELDRLGKQGFRLSMDQVTALDFDVADLRRLHIRFIKIEAGRLLDQTRASTQRLDIRAFKRALDEQAIDLIVEKIESEQTLLEILDMPVDFGQGYLFGEPRLAKEAPKDAA